MHTAGSSLPNCHISNTLNPVDQITVTSHWCKITW